MLNYSVLPDLIALAALVIVFRAMLRRHAGDQLDSWLLGWIFVLLHFCAQLLDVGNGHGENVARTASVLLQELAGIAFIRAASRFDILAARPVCLSTWTLGVLGYSALACWDVRSALPYALAVLVMTAGITMLNFSVRTSRSLRDNIFSFAASWILALTLVALLFLHRAAYGVDAILTWLYLMAGLRYSQRFWKRSTGARTAVAGFFAWASVFPLSLLLTRYAPALQIQSETWNIPKYIVAVGILLTFLESQIDRAEHLALHDPLTGLPNRRLFEDRLEKILQRAERNQTLAAVLQVDMDGFKQINDTYGHATGDEVLRITAQRLQGSVRRSDTIARTGGDEFTLILADLTLAQSADMLAQKIQEEMNRPLKIGAMLVRIAGSIGVAIYPDDASTADALCALADAGMYAAKRRSKAQTNLGVEN